MEKKELASYELPDLKIIFQDNKEFFLLSKKVKQKITNSFVFANEYFFEVTFLPEELIQKLELGNQVKKVEIIEIMKNINGENYQKITSLELPILSVSREITSSSRSNFTIYIKKTN